MAISEQLMIGKWNYYHCKFVNLYREEERIK